MRKTAPEQKTAFQTIHDWSLDRPVWQRDALRRIIAKGKLNEPEIKELVSLCKYGRGKEDEEHRPIPLAQDHIPANPEEGSFIRLTSISDVDGVNNLAPGQVFTFEQDGLTVIYGDNGTGKSGYARILKRACRARHPGDIHPNIYSAQATPPVPSATVKYSVGGIEQVPVKWQDDSSLHPVLSAVSVFDSECAAIHIGEKNEVAFRPFGLDVPDELAGICQAIKEALANEQKQLQKAQNPIFLKPTWKPHTAVGKTLSDLKHDTDNERLKTLANLSDDERARLVRLKEDLSKDPLKAVAEQRLKADNVKRLAILLKTIGDATNTTALFEEYVQKDAEREAHKAVELAAQAHGKLKVVAIDSRALKPYRQEVALHNSELARQVLRFLAAARLRKGALLKSIAAGTEAKLIEISADPAMGLNQLEGKIRAYALELERSAKGDERKKLENELAELSDRAVLNDIMETVFEEISRLKSLRFLEECIGDTSTHAITKMGNDIADTVITPKLRERFHSEIVRLAAERVRVEIVRSGGKYGSPQYQVRLLAKPDVRVDTILSEGERTCVALAAFLTELATATHRSTLIFDDPVSSLDHRWRKQVAKRLVEESEIRQIIVFTHDLVFANDLLDMAKDKDRPIKPVTVSRSAAGTGIVSEGMPWKAQSVEDRIDKMEKAARAAKELYEKHQEDEYRKEATALYNQLRASWERALEDIAFFRVVQRHRDYIDTKHLKKVSALNDQDCDKFHAGFKKCCDVVDAHDPSSGRNAEVPPPAELEQDIQNLKDWVSDLRGRQKLVA